MEYHKKKKDSMAAYFSVEASLIMFLVIMILISAIYVAFYFYDRCLMNQDLYLLCHRGSIMTDDKEGYLEVIYGARTGISEEDIDAYIQKRFEKLISEKEKTGKYPMMTKAEADIHISRSIGKLLFEKMIVEIKFRGINKLPYGKPKRGFHYEISTQSKRINPLCRIRERKKSG